MSHPPTGWPHDHGPTNVGAMVKILVSPVTKLKKLESVKVDFIAPNLSGLCTLNCNGIYKLKENEYIKEYI